MMVERERTFTEMQSIIQGRQRAGGIKQPARDRAGRAHMYPDLAEEGWME